MGGSSRRAAPAAVLVAGLAVLVLAGRLLPSTPSLPRPAPPTAAGVTTGTVPTVPPQDDPASTARRVRVPDTVGHTLDRATSLVRARGLRSATFEPDPQIGTAVVVAHEPPAGVLARPGSVVVFRSRTDVQANHTPSRLWLGPGPAIVTYPVVVPDPARHRLTVVVVTPPGLALRVWLATGSGRRLPVLDTGRDTTSCQPAGGRSRCTVRLGTFEGEDPGMWTATITKQSSPRAAVQVTVGFAPNPGQGPALRRGRVPGRLR